MIGTGNEKQQESAAVRDDVRPFWLVVGTLGVVAALGALSAMAMNAFLPFISEDLGHSVPVLGQITTVAVLLGAGIGLIGGPLADRYGQRRFLIFGAVAVIVAAAGTALAMSVGVLFIARLATAFSSGFLGGTPVAMAAVLYSGPQRRKAVSGVFAGMAGGPVVGLPILTFIGSLTSWRGAFATLAVFGVATIWLLVLALPGAAKTGHPSPAFRMSEVLTAYLPLLGDRGMRTLYIASFLRSTCWMAILMYFGAFLRDQFGSGVGAIGLALMVAGGGFFLGSVAAGSWLKHVPLRPLYGFTSVTLAPIVIAVVAIPVNAAVSAALLTAAAVVASIGNICLTTLLAEETPAGITTTQGLNATVTKLATAAGSAIGGALIVVGGYATLGIGLAGLTVLSAALVVWPVFASRAGATTIEGSRV